MAEAEIGNRESRWSLQGMTALVTGGTKGIGYAVVEELASLGASVHTCSRDEAQLNVCLHEWKTKGFRVTGSVCDVASQAQREELISTVSSLFNGKLNILINNVGTNTPKQTIEYTVEDFSFLMCTNLESAYHMCQLAYPLLKVSRVGSIVFVSSVAGVVGLTLPVSIYAAAKGGLNQLAKNLACEWAKDNIRSNSIAPWVIKTPLAETMAPSPPKKKTTAKKSDKRLKMDSKLFRSVHHFERYRDNFLSAGIIQERFVDLEDLRQTFIPSCFEGRGWEKLLSDFPVVCEPLIREFYSNAVIKENELSCWVRGKEFILDAHVIDEALGLEGLDDEEFINYKDRSVSIETVQQRIGGQREGKCLNTTAFPVDMRCLTIIMMFNLYPIKKLTTINCARAIFLMDLKEKNFIDISSHIYDIIVDETRTTSRPKLIFPSLLMRIFRRKGVPILQDISPMSTPSAINRLTCKRISVRLPGEEDEGDEGEGVPMETEAEAAGHPSTSTPRRSGKRPRASTSSDTPPDAFQIILERLDGIREVQTEHSERMKAMQDQIDVLTAKLDSFTTQPEH